MLVERIKQLAKERKVSMAQVERDLNFGNSTIRKWDESRPSIDRLLKVADYFNVSLDYLEGRTNIRNLPKEVEKYESFDKLSNSDVAEAINFLMEQLGSENYALLFDGDELDDETRELLLISLKNTYELADKLKKKKD